MDSTQQPTELFCSICGKTLIIDENDELKVGCQSCKIVFQIDENTQIIDSKIVNLYEFRQIFKDNSVLKIEKEKRRENRMINFVWLMIFIILLLVSWILY